MCYIMWIFDFIMIVFIPPIGEEVIIRVAGISEWVNDFNKTQHIEPIRKLNKKNEI